MIQIFSKSTNFQNYKRIEDLFKVGLISEAISCCHFIDAYFTDKIGSRIKGTTL